MKVVWQHSTEAWELQVAVIAEKPPLSKATISQQSQPIFSRTSAAQEAELAPVRHALLRAVSPIVLRFEDAPSDSCKGRPSPARHSDPLNLSFGLREDWAALVE